MKLYIASGLDQEYIGPLVLTISFMGPWIAFKYIILQHTNFQIPFRKRVDKGVNSQQRWTRYTQVYHAIFIPWHVVLP